MIRGISKNFKKNGYITDEEKEFLKIVSMYKNKKGVATKDAKKAQEILWHLSGEPFRHYLDYVEEKDYVYSYK